MPCRVDICQRCNDYHCKCGQPEFEARFQFDFEGALCDVLSLLEEESPKLLKKVDPKTLERWKAHETEETEEIKRKALLKLSHRERRVLGIK